MTHRIKKRFTALEVLDEIEKLNTMEFDPNLIQTVADRIGFCSIADSFSGGMVGSLSDGMNGSLSGGMNESLSGGMNESLSGGMNESLSGGMNESLSGGMMNVRW